MQNTKENPFFEIANWQPLGAAPFSEIKAQHYIPALQRHLSEARKRIADIRQDPSPGFSRTIEAVESCSEDADIVASVYFNLLNAEATDEHQKLAQELSSMLAEFSSDLTLDPDLFAKIKDVYDHRMNEKLSTEQSRLLEKMYLDFVRNGALLPDDKKTKLREIDQEMSKLGPQFSENLLKANNKFNLHITDEAELAGLPQTAIEAAADAAKSKSLEGWLFTLDAPSYIPFMTYANHRGHRETLWRAYNGRCFNGEFDNQEILRKIVGLRQERARLLGFESHADFVLQERMAEKPEKVQAFLRELLTASKKAAERDLEEIKQFRFTTEGERDFQPWDFAYYSEKLSQKKYGLDQEMLRPYFELNRVVGGLFEHARRLYGLIFKETDQVPVYHPDVKTFEVLDEATGSMVGLFYTDFYPRPTKKGGAWMTTYRDQGRFHGNVARPHVSIVCNVTKPTSSNPALLTFDEVRTLFHEFGHSLHALLSNCTYRSLSGTNVFWDFVELPSQIMENWTLERESLNLFARHYQTNEPLPVDLAAKINASSKHMAGYMSLRQISFGLLDMAWHSGSSDLSQSVDELEAAATRESTLLPKIPGTNLSCGFAHIFAGGYSAGYYSYKWAEVLDADAFELFKEKGIFNPSVAKSFRENILSRGGTEHPMELYKRFRGREPDPKALLRRDGLI